MPLAVAHTVIPTSLRAMLLRTEGVLLIGTRSSTLARLGCLRANLMLSLHGHLLLAGGISG